MLPDYFEKIRGRSAKIIVFRNGAMISGLNIANLAGWQKSIPAFRAWR